MSEIVVKGPMGPDQVREITHGQMRIMGRAGDTRIIWDPGNGDEVANAKRTFDELRKKKFLAFKVGEGGRKGEQIDEFDPSAEKLIIAPPMGGGMFA